MVWKVNGNWKKGRDLNNEKGEEKSVQGRNTESTQAEPWYQARQGQKFQEVEKRKISITKRMALDSLIRFFSGWMLGSLDLEQSEIKSHGRCLNRGGTRYDSYFRNMVWK